MAIASEVRASVDMRFNCVGVVYVTAFDICVLFLWKLVLFERPRSSEVRARRIWSGELSGSWRIANYVG